MFSAGIFSAERLLLLPVSSEAKAECIYTVDHIYELSYIRPMNFDANQLFSTLANEIRLRTVMLLQREGELCVCELTHALELSQPMISRHLAVLRDSEVLVARRDATWMYYRINPDLPGWVHEILQTTLVGVDGNDPFVSDSRKLKTMTNRPGSGCCA